MRRQVNTPICDFVRRYAASDALRLHMPGHKGASVLGMEALDITEIDGADSLYEADGIIRESERNASALFGSAETFYSTEGSSLCIRAMLALLRQHIGTERPLIAAGRNAHKTFLSACALLDFDVLWLSGTEGSYLSCILSPEEIARQLEAAHPKPSALYITSPDYLGFVQDITALRAVCDRFGMLLLVDNAHGAYLNFLPENRHPLALGADLCCDSAHKTLPVLTGGAYLHIAYRAPQAMRDAARDAMALFGSTSPSYLILQSLDACNACLAGDYRSELQALCEAAGACRARLEAAGWKFIGDEPIKLTLDAKASGYTGREIAGCLLKMGIVSEFADPDFVVWMVTPQTGAKGLARLEAALGTLEPREPITESAPALPRPLRRMSIREAMLSPREILPIDACEGRILASASVGCPPAVPIAVCGEEITREAIECFRYYGINFCQIILQNHLTL